MYRHSFKVSSNPEVRRRGLPRAPRNNSALEDCVADEEKRPLKNSKQNPGYSTSPGENDTKDVLLNSGKTSDAHKEPKNRYVARLLGEKHH